MLHPLVFRTCRVEECLKSLAFWRSKESAVATLSVLWMISQAYSCMHCTAPQQIWRIAALAMMKMKTAKSCRLSVRKGIGVGYCLFPGSRQKDASKKTPSMHDISLGPWKWLVSESRPWQVTMFPHRHHNHHTETQHRPVVKHWLKCTLACWADSSMGTRHPRSEQEKKAAVCWQNSGRMPEEGAGELQLTTYPAQVSCRGFFKPLNSMLPEEVEEKAIFRLWLWQRDTSWGNREATYCSTKKCQLQGVAGRCPCLRPDQPNVFWNVRAGPQVKTLLLAHNDLDPWGLTEVPQWTIGSNTNQSATWPGAGQAQVCGCPPAMQSLWALSGEKRDGGGVSPRWDGSQLKSLHLAFRHQQTCDMQADICLSANQGILPLHYLEVFIMFKYSMNHYFHPSM